MPPIFQGFRNFYTTAGTFLRCTAWVHCHRQPPSSFSLDGHYVNKSCTVGGANPAKSPSGQTGLWSVGVGIGRLLSCLYFNTIGN